MKNFPVNVEGKEYWISRSVAVVGFIFTSNEKGELFVLANKRGDGCPDFNGYWNCPCGYLDYNETGEEAVARETFEETGVHINASKFVQLEISTDPNNNHQNVTIRYATYVPNGLNIPLSNEYNEKNETSEIAWVSFKDAKNLKWAFNHDELIKKCYGKFALSGLSY